MGRLRQARRRAALVASGSVLVAHGAHRPRGSRAWSRRRRPVALRDNILSSRRSFRRRRHDGVGGRGRGLRAPVVSGL